MASSAATTSTTDQHVSAASTNAAIDPSPPTTSPRLTSWRRTLLSASYLELAGISREGAFVTVGDVLVLYAERAEGAAIWTRIDGRWSEPIPVPGSPRTDPGVVDTDGESSPTDGRSSLTSASTSRRRTDGRPCPGRMP
jgi:hypothetical protein